MNRTIFFDFTHLLNRLLVETPSGIDLVDLAYGIHFANVIDSPGAVHYGAGFARSRQPNILKEIVAASQQNWTLANNQHSALPVIQEWLSNYPKKAWAQKPPLKPANFSRKTLARKILQNKIRLTGLVAPALPQGAIYLNIAQHLLENEKYFQWLNSRQDILPVFFVHDLLPLDYPEFFREGYLPLFQKRVKTITRYAGAIVTTTHTVANRLRIELHKAGKPDIPIHVEPLPSPILLSSPRSSKSLLSSDPYFIIVGTIEPRKNHLLILNIWRSLASQGGAIPKLLIVGARGWDSEQVCDMLDRCLNISPYIFEISGLTSFELETVLKGARALLMPSHDEGYGLPVVEALSLGVPVIANDIKVFREVSQQKAKLISCMDGIGWRDAIKKFAISNVNEISTAQEFVPPSWNEYFENIQKFLRGL